jgi:hypothetical protein
LQFEVIPWPKGGIFDSCPVLRINYAAGFSAKLAGETSQTGAKQPVSNIVDARQIKVSACFGYFRGSTRSE